MRYAPLILAALVTILVLASPVQSKMAAVCTGQQPAKQELACGLKNWYHATGAIRFLRTHPWAGTKQSRRELGRGMLWLQKYAKEHIVAARARLNPLPAHYAGWHCITYGDTGGPHEGHGWNGHTYSGALQMTNPWMGHSAPGGDWNNLSDVQVYWVAEREMRKSHFSYSAMKGQWPLTFPPCAGYF